MGDELNIMWLLAIGLGFASILGYIAQRLKLSPILGYLLAGYLIGPNSPGFVADMALSEQLANIGVTLLMFVVGLNFSWKDLAAVKKIALPGAITLSIFSILAGMFFSIYIGESSIAGFVIGLSICVSSTVVIVRVLADQGLLQSRQGHIVVGWTIVEDLISVFGLLLLPALAPSAVSTDSSALNTLYSIIWVIIKIALLGAFVYFIGEKFIDKLLKVIARTRSHELFTLSVLACAFLIAIGSSYFFGVSLALGAFIAGTIVGKTDMSHQAAANAVPMRDVFAVIFFLSVGMLFSPKAIMNNISLFIGILIILLLIRPFLAFTFVKIGKYPSTVAFTVALAIAQIGEYSFILAEEGSQLGILPDNGFDILVACSFITIALNPLLFQIFQSVCKKRVGTLNVTSEFEDSKISHLYNSEGGIQPNLQAIVIGFGPVGQAVARYLLNTGHQVTIIDQNIDTISFIKGKQMKAVFGDATQFHILEKGSIEDASFMVITTPDFSTTQSIIQTARTINPFIQIIARSQFKADLQRNRFEDIPIICDEDASSEKFISYLQSQLVRS